MTILLSDPRVAAVPVHDNGEPLVRWHWSYGDRYRALATGAGVALDPVELGRAAA